MRISNSLLLFFLLICFSTVEAQQLVTLQDSAMLPSERPRLSTSGKDSLSSSLAGKTVKGVVVLKVQTQVEIVRRSRFLQKETVYDRETATKKSVSRLVKVALVKVLDGEHKGDTGWVVLSYRDTGGDPQILLSDDPAAFAGKPKTKE